MSDLPLDLSLQFIVSHARIPYLRRSRNLPSTTISAVPAFPSFVSIDSRARPQSDSPRLASLKPRGLPELTPVSLRFHGNFVFVRWRHRSTGTLCWLWRLGMVWCVWGSWLFYERGQSDRTMGCHALNQCRQAFRRPDGVRSGLGTLK